MEAGVGFETDEQVPQKAIVDNGHFSGHSAVAKPRLLHDISRPPGHLFPYP